MNWQAIIKIILGELSPEHFIAYFALMCAGAFVYFVLDVRQSTRTDSATSRKFSFKFMVLDNLLRGVAVLILIMAAVIWYDSFFGVPINAKLAFASGLSIDAVIGVVLKEGKQIGPIKRSREKLMQKYK